MGFETRQKNVCEAKHVSSDQIKLVKTSQPIKRLVHSTCQNNGKNVTKLVTFSFYHVPIQLHLLLFFTSVFF